LALAALDLESGRLAAARASLEESLRTARASSDTRGVALAEMLFGAVAQRAGDRAQARVSFEAAATRFEELGHRALASAAAARLLDLASEGRTTPPDDALVIAESGAWFRAPAAPRVGLERRKSLGRILACLAEERIERPGSPLGSRALQE